MNADKKISRVLGWAFLIQAITSLSGGLIWSNQDLIVPGNVSKSLLQIAQHPGTVRMYIFCEITTAVGVIFLGAVLFIALRKQNKQMALVALGFYILEGALLAASKIATIALLPISQEYVAAGHSAYLLTLGKLALEATDFGMTLLMWPFSLGAILFYYLLDKSRLVPRPLSLWGLISVFTCLFGTLAALFGYEMPFLLYVPYAPFEFVIGIWILVKGIRVED